MTIHEYIRCNMFAEYYIYFLLQFILLFNEQCHGNPLIGQNVQPAEKDEFPFIVSLSKTCNIIDKENHFCGGALISKKHVLTAAHCTWSLTTSCVDVIVGSNDFESGRIYKIESWITYDRWVRNKHHIFQQYRINDLAIITLSQDVKNIVPANISKLTKDEVIGKDVVTAGWGLVSSLDDNFTLVTPESLQKAYMKVLSVEKFQCNERKLFNRLRDMPANQYFTAAKPPVVVSRGDSGGPLLLSSNHEIVGINESCCNIKNPDENPNAMSTHVAVAYHEYRDFIESILNSGA